MINTLAVVNGPVVYKHIIDHINQLVSKLHNVAARRCSSKTFDKDTTPIFLPSPRYSGFVACGRIV